MMTAPGSTAASSNVRDSMGPQSGWSKALRTSLSSMLFPTFRSSRRLAALAVAGLAAAMNASAEVAAFSRFTSWRTCVAKVRCPRRLWQGGAGALSHRFLRRLANVSQLPGGLNKLSTIRDGRTGVLRTMFSVLLSDLCLSSKEPVPSCLRLNPPEACRLPFEAIYRATVTLR
eukprot:7379842-Prymnesium_polylepis.1